MNPIERVDFPEIDGWIERCAMRGVQLEQMLVIPQLFSIVVCRDLALGSDGKVSEMTQYVQLYGGTIDENGRKFLARQHAKLRFGAGDADSIIPEISRDQSPTDQSSFATLENNMMKAGMPAQVGMDQMHWSHIPVHAQILQEIVDQVHAPEDNGGGAPAASQAFAAESGANPGEDIENPRGLLQLLQMASQHIQEHLQYGAQQIGMQEQAEQVMKMLRDLRPTIKALNLAVATQERVEQAQREEQQREMEALQEQASQAEIEKAKYKVDRDAEIARYRVDRENEVAMRKLELEGRRGAVKDDIAVRRADGDEARRDAETSARIDAQQKLAQAKVSAANSAARFDATNQVTGQQTVSPSDIIGGGGDEEALNYTSL